MNEETLDQFLHINEDLNTHNGIDVSIPLSAVVVQDKEEMVNRLKELEREREILEQEILQARQEQQQRQHTTEITTSETSLLPIIVETICDDDVKNLSSSSRLPFKQRLFLGAIFIFLLIGAIVLIILIRSDDNLVVPVSPAVNPEVADLIDRFVLQKPDLDTESMFLDETPQNRAIYWLALEDEWTRDAMTNDNIPIQMIVERYALVVLYYGTNGPTWSELSLQFLQPVSLCQWNLPVDVGTRNVSMGVSCDDDDFVSYLNFGQTRLFGSLPSEISLLSNLQHLDLNNNELSGPLPLELFRVTTLTYLDLRENPWNSTIPSDIGMLRNLSHLDVTSASLFGQLPSELGHLTELQILKLWSNVDLSIALTANALTGMIPTELGFLTMLSYLDFDGNGLIGTLPSELGHMTALREIFLRENLLTGPIPSELGLLTTLSKMDFSNNLLNGSIPSELGRLTNLSFLSLSENRLTGMLPSEMGPLTALTDLYANNNLLTGTIPSEIGRLTNLWGLWLFENRLTGMLPSEMGNLASVVFLILSDNFFSGPLPSELGNMTDLQGIYLSGNSFSGIVPSELGNLVRLSTLTLESNNVMEGLERMFCNQSSTTTFSKIPDISADCLGTSPEVMCSCCTQCCGNDDDESGLFSCENNTQN